MISPLSVLRKEDKPLNNALVIEFLSDGRIPPSIAFSNPLFTSNQFLPIERVSVLRALIVLEIASA